MFVETGAVENLEQTRAGWPEARRAWKRVVHFNKVITNKIN
jgi:hypothetical protein